MKFTGISIADLGQTYREGWHLFLSTAAMTLYTRSNTFILGLIASEAAVGPSRPLRARRGRQILVFPLSTAIFHT